MNLTAERSLEIITEQIKRSRKAVSQEVGQSLYIAGLCIMGMAIFLARFFDLASFYRYSHIPPGIMVLLFSFVGLTLPGWMLKNSNSPCRSNH